MTSLHGIDLDYLVHRYMTIGKGMPLTTIARTTNCHPEDIQSDIFNIYYVVRDVTTNDASVILPEYERIYQGRTTPSSFLIPSSH